MRNLGEILSERESIAQEMQVNFWGLQNNFNSFGVFKTISSALESSKQFQQLWSLQNNFLKLSHHWKAKQEQCFLGGFWFLHFYQMDVCHDPCGPSLYLMKILICLSICQINTYQMEILQIV